MDGHYTFRERIEELNNDCLGYFLYYKLKQKIKGILYRYIG